MMVIQGTVAAGSGLTAGTHIFPADRCTWRQSTATGGGYNIDGAVFWGGFGDGQSNRTGAITISSPRLGFIGKSGRFVEIAG